MKMSRKRISKSPVNPEDNRQVAKRLSEEDAEIEKFRESKRRYKRRVWDRLFGISHSERDARVQIKGS
jgi:hypothetical protein